MFTAKGDVGHVIILVEKTRTSIRSVRCRQPGSTCADDNDIGVVSCCAKASTAATDADTPIGTVSGGTPCPTVLRPGFGRLVPHSSVCRLLD